ncbi:MAG: hypothetical protein CNE43_01725 [Halieaceae bacterium MED-G26]|nr:MAG: hypothetical protein CNE43_01725 [Halieaceae bacterium MED-G26]
MMNKQYLIKLTLSLYHKTSNVTKKLQAWGSDRLFLANVSAALRGLSPRSALACLSVWALISAAATRE